MLESSRHTSGVLFQNIPQMWDNTTGRYRLHQQLFMLISVNVSNWAVIHMFTQDDKLTLQTLYWLVNFYEGKAMWHKAEELRQEIDRQLDEKLAQCKRNKFTQQAA
jgi:hypothetical protein